MPGSGKSTLGAMLSKLLAKDFVDTDLLLQTKEGASLQSILDMHGYKVLRDLEEQLLLSLQSTNQVIATGGSAVYSEQSMTHLKHFGPTIFLDVPQQELERRINNFEERGVARSPNQTFSELFVERRSLYLRHAEITIDCSGKTEEAIIAEIIYQEGHGYTEEDA
jgi:shikimate kinase